MRLITKNARPKFKNGSNTVIFFGPMFKFIKSIFTNELSANGDLVVQGIGKGEASASYTGDQLTFKAGEEEFVLLIKEIKSLEMDKETIRLVVSNKKYTFTSSRSKDIYKILRPMVLDQSLFITSEVSYLVYNSSTRLFDEYKEPVTLHIIENDFHYLRVEDKSSIIHFEKICTSTQYYVDGDNKAFVWSTYSDGMFYTFSLRFKNEQIFLLFREKYLECCYKSVNEGEAPEAIYKDIGVYKGSEKESAKDENVDQPIGNENGAKFPSQDDINSPSKVKGGKSSVDGSYNKLLVMGGSQCFVTRGSSLGVFGIESDDVKFRAQIKNAVEDPQKILAHNGDSSLLILEKNNLSRLGLMDLEKGEVIERWDVGSNLNDYFDSVPRRNDGTLVGLSDRALLRIDPRVPEHVVSKKEYKCKNEFSCGSATDRGSVAVASRKGDIRLYDKIDKRAKTLLPGFGDEILGIDTSKDGSLVLCTCKSYLLLFQVVSNYAINSKNTVPIRLQLKPQHLSLFKEEINFTPAKFDQEDSTIITSSGRYVIRWKVSDVLDYNVYNYTFRSLGERVVDEDFIIDGRDIVAVTRNDVRKMRESDLRRP